MWFELGEKKKGKLSPTEHAGPPEGGMIIAVAEKFGVLPDTVENEMSVYWFERVATLMEAQALNERRITRERERKANLGRKFR